jgi:hypothetical protein
MKPELTIPEDLTASSQVPEEAKPAAAAPPKKKKRANRALKITNTHMKQQVRNLSIALPDILVYWLTSDRASTFRRTMSLVLDGLCTR